MIKLQDTKLQKYVAFLYTNRKLSETEIKETISFTITSERVKSLPAMQEIRVWFLGWEDPLEKEMVTLSRILAWRMPWTEEPGRLQSRRSQESDMAVQISTHKRRRRTCIPKSIRLWLKAMKMTQTDENLYHALGLTELILLRWPYYPRQTITSIKIPTAFLQS